MPGGFGAKVGTKITPKVITKAGTLAYKSKYFGVSSKLFGNGRWGDAAGKWNNYGKIKVGWSHVGTKASGQAVFRIGYKAFGKDRHIDMFKGPRLW